MRSLQKWVIITGLVLALSFVSIGLMAARALCEAVHFGSITSDTLTLSLTLVRGRIDDAAMKVDAAFSMLHTAMRKA